MLYEGKVLGWFWDQTLGVLLSFMEEYEVKKILGALFLKIGFSDETSIPWKWWTQCLFWLAHRIVSQEWQNYTQAMIPICTRTPPSCSTYGQSLSNNSNSFGTNSECWFCHFFWHSPHLMSNYPKMIRFLENKFSRESCRGGKHMQISTSSKIVCFPKRNKLYLASDIDIVLLILQK